MYQLYVGAAKSVHIHCEVQSYEQSIHARTSQHWLNPLEQLKISQRWSRGQQTSAFSSLSKTGQNNATIHSIFVCKLAAYFNNSQRLGRVGFVQVVDEARQREGENEIILPETPNLHVVNPISKAKFPTKVTQNMHVNDRSAANHCTGNAAKTHELMNTNEGDNMTKILRQIRN